MGDITVTEAARLVADLVAIDSVNPNLVPGAAGEAEVAAYLAGRCEALGLVVRLQEAAPGRPNVIATRRGGGGGRSLLLNGHTDTVGHGWMEQPLTAHKAGTVGGLSAEIGATVAAGAVICQIKDLVEE